MMSLAALLGLTALVLTLYTMAHTESVPITGRKRFIFITHDQLMKIVQIEVEDVSIFFLYKVHSFQMKNYWYWFFVNEYLNQSCK
jgi:hypothetical protein